MQAQLAAPGMYILLLPSQLLRDQLAAALFPSPGCSWAVGWDKAKRFSHPLACWKSAAWFGDQAHSFIFLDYAEYFSSCSAVPSAPFQTSQVFYIPNSSPCYQGPVSSVRMLTWMLWFYYSFFSYST